MFRLFSTVRIRSERVTSHLLELRSKKMPVGNGLSSKEFLERIGRKSAQHSQKFKDLEDLFNSSSETMKSLGLKPRESKYISSWKEW